MSTLHVSHLTNQVSDTGVSLEVEIVPEPAPKVQKANWHVYAMIGAIFGVAMAFANPTNIPIVFASGCWGCIGFIICLLTLTDVDQQQEFPSAWMSFRQSVVLGFSLFLTCLVIQFVWRVIL